MTLKPTPEMPEQAQ